MSRRRRKADGTVVTGRRPRLLDPNVRKAILGALAAGASIEAACAIAGVHPAAFYNWMNRAADEIDRLVNTEATQKPGAEPPQPRPEERVFVEFVEQVSRVRAERQVEMLGHIAKVAKGGYVLSHTETHTPEGGYIVQDRYATPDWRAAQWWIERTFPNQFSRNVEGGSHNTLEVTGKDGGPIEVVNAATISALSDRLRVSFARQAADAPALSAGTARTEVEDEGAVDAEIVEDQTATS